MAEKLPDLKRHLSRTNQRLDRLKILTDRAIAAENTDQISKFAEEVERRELTAAYLSMRIDALEK